MTTELLVHYILLFFVYAFLGWCIEVVGKIIELKRFVNRGFLIGPICPIYGWGVLGILLINYNHGGDVLGVFLKSLLVCSILEYFTSWFMEFFFKARWWDYSRRKFNINGRICLETMIPFGLLGVFVVYILNPIISGFINIFPFTIQEIVCIVFIIIYIVDNIFSNMAVIGIRNEINDTAKDNTEYMREKVFNWIDNNSYIYRRIREAYPNFDIKGKIKVAEDEVVKTVLVANDKITVYKTKFNDNGEKIKEKFKQYEVDTRDKINAEIKKQVEKEEEKIEKAKRKRNRHRKSKNK